MSNLFTALRVGAQGMTAQRTRLNTTASNIANVQTTRTEEGGPYKRQDPIFQTVGIDKGVDGVRVDQVIEDQAEPRLVYDPGHPDSNADGYVAMPNVNLVEEMVNMITAQRAYDANASTIDTVKKMAKSALAIGDG